MGHINIIAVILNDSNEVLNASPNLSEIQANPDENEQKLFCFAEFFGKIYTIVSDFYYSLDEANASFH